MVKFIIIRHGLTDFNKIHKYQGQFDSSLEPLGVEQAELTAKHVAENYHVDAIYASDLSRTVNTAKPFARLLGLPVSTTPAFREIDVGEWAQQFIADVKKTDPEGVRIYNEDPGVFRFPGGENFAEVYERTAKKIEEIAEKHDGETVLIISHGGVIRTLIARWLGYPIRELRRVKPMGNTAITIAEYENGKAKLLLIGDNSHLPEDMR